MCMPKQEKAERRTGRDVEVDDVKATVEVATKAGLDADVDSILDEIDEVLEENSEDFVKSFVQKVANDPASWTPTGLSRNRLVFIRRLSGGSGP